jgi:hypothetical protein
MDSVSIVEDFWTAVWKARNPEAIDRFVVDVFVIATGGVDIVTKDRFKEWVRQFQARISDLEFDMQALFATGR